MSVLEQLQAKLTIKMAEIDAICREHKYSATPTLLLRHNDGANKSILMGNDSLSQVVLCVAALGDVGNESAMSSQDAILRLFAGAERNEQAIDWPTTPANVPRFPVEEPK